MTPRPDLAQLAAEALAKEGSRRRLRNGVEEAAAIAAVAAAIVSRRRRARRRRWALGGLAAAATLALTLGLARRATLAPAAVAARTATPPVAAPIPSAEDHSAATVDALSGEAFVLHSGASRSVAVGATIGPGDQMVVAHGANVALSLPSGTRLMAEESADLTVLAQGTTQLFRLTSGSLRAAVHKLAPGERFVVQTLDAEVEVRGTAFRVFAGASEVGCASGTTTRLTVDEGVVTVRARGSEVSVPAGQTWPACATGDAAAPLTAAQRPSSVATPGRGASSTSTSVGSARTALAEQNDLYASAIAARDRGDAAIAVDLFEWLAAHYPASPLAESALAERMKILAATSPGRAVHAATEYLARFPSGSARADAEALLARSGAH